MSEWISRKDAKTQRVEEVEDAINRMLENFASLRLERSEREVHRVSASVTGRRSVGEYQSAFISVHQRFLYSKSFRLVELVGEDGVRVDQP